MPAQTESRSGLYWGWDLGESGWKTEMDANLLSIGRFAYHLSVKDRDLSAPPGSPADGDAYIVGAAATGSWVGKDGNVAVWDEGGGAWMFGVPRVGWVAYIEDEEKLSAYKPGGWSEGVAI
jgi:hypothetical protein